MIPPACAALVFVRSLRAICCEDRHSYTKRSLTLVQQRSHTHSHTNRLAFDVKKISVENSIRVYGDGNDGRVLSILKSLFFSIISVPVAIIRKITNKITFAINRNQNQTNYFQFIFVSDPDWPQCALQCFNEDERRQAKRMNEKVSMLSSEETWKRKWWNPITAQWDYELCVTETVVGRSENY